RLSRCSSAAPHLMHSTGGRTRRERVLVKWAPRSRARRRRNRHRGLRRAIWGKFCYASSTCGTRGQGATGSAAAGAAMADARYKKLSVLMPVYNEARTLRRIVKAVLESPVDMEIELVCVDDHSTDDTQKILNELSLADGRIKVIRHAVNCGKGSAI